MNPELELFGGASVTREAGQAWAEPGAAGHDARDGNLTASITVSGTVDMNTTGTYVLTYSVADAAGNEANASRTVTVVDTTNPVLTLLGDANMSQAKDSAWVDPGATASDSLDGNLTSSITITGTVDVNTTGVYTLTYSVSDGASNEANATRTVHVGQASTHNADLNASVQLQMLWVEPGTFTMGSPTTEAGRSTNETEHNVTLTKGFYLGKYEVTQAQYEAVMTGNTDSLSATPSQYGGNPNRPVEKVSLGGCPNFPDPFECPAIRKHTTGLGLCFTHRIAMGICLPGRYEYGIFMGGSASSTQANLMAPSLMETVQLELRLGRPAMWANMRPTPGAFSICTEMSGNGPQTGMVQLIPPATRWWTQQVRHRARIGSTGWFLELRRYGPAFC